jgi:hypothetical protein
MRAGICYTSYRYKWLWRDVTILLQDVAAPAAPSVNAEHFSCARDSSAILMGALKDV